LKNLHAARSGVKNRLEMLMYGHVHCFFADFCLVLHSPETFSTAC